MDRANKTDEPLVSRELSIYIEAPIQIYFSKHLGIDYSHYLSFTFSPALQAISMRTCRSSILDRARKDILAVTAYSTPKPIKIRSIKGSLNTTP